MSGGFSPTFAQFLGQPIWAIRAHLIISSLLHQIFSGKFSQLNPTKHQIYVELVSSNQLSLAVISLFETCHVSYIGQILDKHLSWLSQQNLLTNFIKLIQQINQLSSTVPCLQYWGNIGQTLYLHCYITLKKNFFRQILSTQSHKTISNQLAVNNCHQLLLAVQYVKYWTMIDNHLSQLSEQTGKNLFGKICIAVSN